MNEASRVSSRHDVDLMYLTDTAYFALLDHESENRKSSKNKKKHDGLFLERLESFIEGQYKEMETFANREQRPVDEIRKLVAIPHASYIFSLDPSLPLSDESPQDDTRTIPSIRGTLSRLSNTLQMLHDAAGLDSLLLVVSPRPTPSPTTSTTINSDIGNYDVPSVSSESFENSWIGGTDLGKEFWMSLKGGGLNGARAFRLKCQMQDAELASHAQDSLITSTPSNCLHSLTHTSGSDGHPITKMRSGDVKTELNSAVRHALRSVSGNPAAEMRWTKPASLEELYSVRLIGWPSGVRMRNPSNNSLKDNRLLLDLVRSGKMKFVPMGSPEWCIPPLTIQQINSEFTNESAPPNNGSLISPTIPHSSVVDSLKSHARPIEPRVPIPRSSHSSSRIPSRVHPVSLPTSSLTETVSEVAPSICQVPNHSSGENSFPSSTIAPKRLVEDHNPERVTPNGRQAKRSKLDSAGGKG